MPHFRFIIEGSDFEMPLSGEGGDDSATGFFTTRKAQGIDREAAERAVLQALRDEWSEFRPKLSVLDSWKCSSFEFRRVPNAGHAFFSDDYSRCAAAWLEAKASRAPRSLTIWQLADLYAEGADD